MNSVNISVLGFNIRKLLSFRLYIRRVRFEFHRISLIILIDNVVANILKKFLADSRFCLVVNFSPSGLYFYLED
jgi:hypothetical protein